MKTQFDCLARFVNANGFSVKMRYFVLVALLCMWPVKVGKRITIFNELISLDFTRTGAFSHTFHQTIM